MKPLSWGSAINFQRRYLKNKVDGLKPQESNDYVEHVMYQGKKTLSIMQSLNNNLILLFILERVRHIQECLEQFVEMLKREKTF